MVYTHDTGVVVRTKNKLLLILLAFAFAILGSIGLRLPTYADTTVTISGDTAAGENEPGWMFNRDVSTSTPFEFTTDEASIGDGSLYVEPIGANPADKFIAEYFYLDEVANVESISYDFMTDNASDVDQFYMNLYVNDGIDETEFYDCRYNIVPSVHNPDPVTGFTTFTYSLAAAATSVTTSGGASIACPAAPADLPAGAVLRAIAINVGDTAAGDSGLDGYLDNVVLDTTDDVTTFDFEPFHETGEITSPLEGEEVSGLVTLAATYDDGDDEDDDAVQWAVRAGTCAVGTNTVAGNVDGFSDPDTWDGASFEATFDSTQVDDGEYCFVFNPTDDNFDVRETVEFIVNNVPDTKGECKRGGWASMMDHESNVFKNQGDCVSYVATDGRNLGAGN